MTTNHGARPLLVLDEDQRMLVDAAQELIATEAPVSRARSVRDAGAVIDDALWKHLIELGWAGVLVPEEHGGLGLGLPEAMAFMEVAGRYLAATPMLSALMVGPLAPQLGTADGTRVALAWQEHPRQPDPARVETRWDGATVTGTKVLVLDGAQAEVLIVSARDPKGTLVLLSVDAAQADITPLRRADHRDAARVRFDHVPGRPLPGTADDLVAAIDRGTLALSAELLGLAGAMLDRTLDYLRTRTQFGRPLGAFQALQHRAVDAFIGVELTRSAMLAASFEPSSLHTSLAKAQAATAAARIAEESIQLHGGIGMTDEHDLGMFFKRTFVAIASHGDARWHRRRWASLRGY